MGVWVACPQQQKKSEAPCLEVFLRDIASNDHTCITKMTPNEQKIQQTKYEKNRPQT